MSKLRSGFTTGTHATATLVACVYELLYNKELEYVSITLPNGTTAKIEVTKNTPLSYSSIKTDNDDLDVTKNATLQTTLHMTPPTDLKPQTPSKLQIQNTTLFVYAGDGVGIVTKKGLKVAPEHPAINPTPLHMFQENIKPLLDNTPRTLHAVFSIQNGEVIAKETANAKVGVLGGLSILGTTGIVKPVSSEAYIKSIEAEVQVCAEYFDTIALTLGNTSLKAAKEHFKEEQIVEVGNFIYDSLNIVKRYNFKKIFFFVGIAKAAKIAQGSKNTHNRFGGIDFELMCRWLQEQTSEVCTEEFSTLKALLDSLKCKEEFETFLAHKAQQQLCSWAKQEVKIIITKGKA